MLRLVLRVLFVTFIIFFGLIGAQNWMYKRVGGEAEQEQHESVKRVSEETMSLLMIDSLVRTTYLQADIADGDFTDLRHYASILRNMAQNLFESNRKVTPAEYSLPDPEKDGEWSAMVLFEEGVDYENSEYLGVIANLKESMIAMVTNSDKISACYFGFEDGTHYGVDRTPSMKYDENGELIPFPVRDRPWYRGAIEEGGFYFTGIVEDAFTGEQGITCSVPVKVNGEVIGVAGVDFVLDSLSNISSFGDDEAALLVVNEEGRVIFCSGNPELNLVPEGDTEFYLLNTDVEELNRFVERTLAEETDLTEFIIDDRDCYMVGSPMPSIGWAMIAVVDREVTEIPEKALLADYDEINARIQKKVNDGTAQILLICVIVIVMISIIGSQAVLEGSQKVIMPIVEMTENIQQRKQTGEPFEMKDSYRTDDEIEVLAESFSDLSEKTRQYIADLTEITREKERVSTELQMGSRIQNSMLPSVFPPFPDRKEFDLYATMDPAREVGGDFYDFFLIDDDHLCLVIADVSGKGVPAALFMTESKVILENLARIGKSVPEILESTNESLCVNNQVDMFVTVWFGILEISTGKIRAANAGHEYPAVMKDGAFSLLKDKHGMVIGGIRGVKYKEYEIDLKPGDKLFVYTDGIPEASDEEKRMFGTGKMVEALNQDPGASPEEILNHVRRAVETFVNGAEQFDDMTMLCLEYHGRQGQDQ